MVEKITALLVSDGQEPFEKLGLALENQGVKSYRARSTAEVQAWLNGPESPQMIFTDTAFHGGTWADILTLAARHRVPVIVVSRFVDLDLYIHSLERGAFDFIVPPFVSADLAHVVRCAVWNRSNERTLQASAGL
jgi:DNA-binding NtrC family response regulator